MAQVISVRGCEFPDDRFYHRDYNIWVREEEPDVVVIGATSFGVALAVDFVAFLPKPVGTRVDAGRAVGLLELAKTIVSVRTPVSGTILAANAAAVADPALIRDEPYDAGWLVRMQTDDWAAAKLGLTSGMDIAPAFEEAMRLENFRDSGER